MEPIVGRTHTDLFKTRNRLTSIGGAGGFKLTYLSANGFSYVQVGVIVVVVLFWTIPLMRMGVPFIGWSGMSLLLLLGPPFGLAWAADRTLPNDKSLREWVTTRVRHRFIEKPLYVAGKPSTIMTTTVTCQVWSPDREGLHV